MEIVTFESKKIMLFKINISRDIRIIIFTPFKTEQNMSFSFDESVNHACGRNTLFGPIFIR